jgi:ferredoxin like protein
MKLEDKLFLNKVKRDDRSHIDIVSREVCLRCPDKPCTIVCPAEVYHWDGEKIVVSYENCIECGAARMLCPYANIEWHPPRGGFGVSYKFG